jgi:hypothetical protein
MHLCPKTELVKTITIEKSRSPFTSDGALKNAFAASDPISIARL